MPRTEGLMLPGRAPREPEVRARWPDWVAWKPTTIWRYDPTGARRVAFAVMDVVSRDWLTSLVSAEETSTQVDVALAAAGGGSPLITRARKMPARGSPPAVGAPGFRPLAALGLVRWKVDIQWPANAFLTSMRGPQQVLDLCGAPVRRSSRSPSRPATCRWRSRPSRRR